MAEEQLSSEIEVLNLSEKHGVSHQSNPTIPFDLPIEIVIEIFLKLLIKSLLKISFFQNLGIH